jgi:DNA modification methylase
MTVPLDEIVCGDCLEVLGRLPDGVADLAYLDPPFNTGRTLAAKAASYEDTWTSVDAYLAFLRPRIEATHRVLAPNGVILLHCDWRTCHHLRLMLDELFGVDGFVNHLIWTYGLGGSSPRRVARKHDDILFYARGGAYHFEPPLVPATSHRMRGQMKKATDVIDVPTINNMATERVGYPTQKPLALLELLVGACCPPDGVVLDPFCGSGTTLVAARRTGRRALGIDVSADAVTIARGRLEEAVSPAAG